MNTMSRRDALKLGTNVAVSAAITPLLSQICGSKFDRSGSDFHDVAIFGQHFWLVGGYLFYAGG